MKLTGENRSKWGKLCPSATLSTTDPTWTVPGWNPDLRGEKTYDLDRTATGIV
jgi:hypothetical protein